MRGVKGTGGKKECRDRYYRLHSVRALQMARARNLTKKYGLTQEEYDMLWFAQDGLCRICSRPETQRSRSLRVDHNHRNRQVRGLLCHTCNSGLGMFKDDVGWLIKAISYLMAEGSYSERFGTTL